jgi:hypothetical protein
MPFRTTATLKRRSRSAIWGVSNRAAIHGASAMNPAAETSASARMRRKTLSQRPGRTSFFWIST